MKKLKYKTLKKTLDEHLTVNKYSTEDLLKKVADPKIHEDIIKAARNVANTMGWGSDFEQALPCVEKGDFTTFKKASRNVISTFKSLLRRTDEEAIHATHEELITIYGYNPESRLVYDIYLGNGDVSNDYIVLTKQVLKKAVKLYNKLLKQTGLTSLPSSEQSLIEIFDLCGTKKKERQLISAVIATINL